ncbi:hypothetical protein N9R58_02960 [Gammaproteobacteria bacterium]|nr:hypothetical protein [Gammaproteobacteria bacterium]
MKYFISIILLSISFNSFAEFDTKCSIIITKRLQSSEDAYKDAIQKIKQCAQYDILSVTSFLEKSISKVYITDLIQNFCMFDHSIITILDGNTSNLSCVHRGDQRVERKFPRID